MKSGYFFAAAFLVCFGQSAAEVQNSAVPVAPSQSSAENKAAPPTDPAQDDKASKEKPPQTTADDTMADPVKAHKEPKGLVRPGSGEAASDSLEDPTRMNESFRAALQHSGRATSAPQSGAAAPAPVLPEITLVASVCGRHLDNAAAMLRINDKTEIVHTGDKLTRVEKNQLIEIHILEIHHRFVKVKVFPSNEILILR
jgi:hypothetical protein